MSWSTFADRAAALDAADSLAHLRLLFDIPKDVVYFDGNSLGPMTIRSREVLDRTINVEWRERLIRSWNEDWLAMPLRIGNKIAPIIGAAPDTVIACDNTSINLHKALMAAVALRPGRTEIVIDINNFPTDIYIAQNVADQHGLQLVAVPAEEIASAISERTAVVTATHVDYRSANILDSATITRVAHQHGALMVWDLAHTTGAVPLNATELDIDFAVGCGYKYLNGGPGAPAFIYVAPRLLESASQPLQGWWGHALPFEFELAYRPAHGISRFLTGTTNVLSMKSLEAALEIFDNVSMEDVRAKNQSLTSFFLEIYDEFLAEQGFSLRSPRDPDMRGSHVALGYSDGKALVETLATHGILADFRPPDLIRLGFSALYNTHRDALELAEHLSPIDLL
jgi:kynureninase